VASLTGMSDEETKQASDLAPQGDVDTIVVNEQPGSILDTWPSIVVSWFSGSPVVQASFCAGSTADPGSDLEEGRPAFTRDKSNLRRADMKKKMQKNRRMSLTNVRGLSSHFANGEMRDERAANLTTSNLPVSKPHTLVPSLLTQYPS
jgi:hypothetical protein